MGPSQLLTAALATLATASLVPRAPAAPRLVSVDFSGDGCPDATRNSVKGSMSKLTMSYPDFAAYFVGTDRMNFQKSCLAHLTIEEGVPGFALAVRRISGGGTFVGTGEVSLELRAETFWQIDADNQVNKNITFTNDDVRPSLQQVSFDFDFEDSEAPFVSKCVGDDGDVGSLMVRLRAVVRGWAEGRSASFLGTEASPVTEEVEFAWVACGDLPVEFETPAEGEDVEEGVVVGGGEV